MSEFSRLGTFNLIVYGSTLSHDKPTNLGTHHPKSNIMLTSYLVPRPHIPSKKERESLSQPPTYV